MSFLAQDIYFTRLLTLKKHLFKYILITKKTTITLTTDDRGTWEGDQPQALLLQEPPSAALPNSPPEDRRRAPPT